MTAADQKNLYKDFPPVNNSRMTYKCPRCEGTDIYFAQRPRIQGVGGVYGNKEVMVKTALCKNCGENADLITDSITPKGFLKLGLIFIVVFCLFWLVVGLLSL